MVKTGRYLVLFAILFFLRAAALQCVYPPLEGPDEYQHIAVMHHIMEHRSIPRLNQAKVPESLYPYLQKLPHCNYDWQQTARIGCQPYSDYYTSPSAPELSIINTSIPLYQAQHPPTYYVVFAPVYHFLLKHTGFLNTIYILRFINILFGAGALMLLLVPLFRLKLPHKLKLLTALAVSLSPLFPVYIARVSNDAMALFLGAIGVALLSQLDRSKHSYWVTVFAGFTIGLGTVTKLIVFAFLPASLVFLCVCFRKKFSFKQRLGLISCLTTGYLITALPYHIWAVVTYGVPFPAQETIQNAAKNIGFFELLHYADFDHWTTFIFHRMLIGTLWRSGWSFLLPASKLSSFYSLFFWIAALGALIWPIRLIFQQKNAGNGNRSIWIYCWLLTGACYAAAYVHALNCIQAHGDILTPSYYVMPVFPMLGILLLGVFLAYGNRCAVWLLISLSLINFMTELHSLFWIAIPHWTATDNFTVAYQRLHAIHPGFPSPIFYPLFLLGVLFLIIRIVFFTQSHTDHNGIV